MAAAPSLPAPAPVARPRRAAPPLVCAACGTTNAHDARFCQSCAAPLTVEPSIDTRKFVTVLFCDVVGYSELGERLDPESLRLVMSRYFEQAAAVLEQHGGTVEKFVGDEVMAVFGVPAVREDDALRAIRTAVALRDWTAALETEFGSDARLQVRIGINTGEVVVGNPAAGHGFVTGDAVTVGKRLEEAAAPGEILLGKDTHILVAHAVEASPLEPLKLKGKRREVTAFRLESVDAGASAIPRRDDAPFVGREREREQLRSLYEVVASGGGARQVTLVGEPGIGKSRLGREFLAGLAGEATVLVGRCHRTERASPSGRCASCSGRPDATKGSWSAGATRSSPTVRRILEELARERPLIVVFDDLHWAEPTFLDFVEYLAGRLGEAPVLLLCLTRPELAERRPAWLQEPGAALVLEPLSEADSGMLLEALGAPAAVRPRIAEAAEGNPLFVEQLAAIADEYSAAGEMPGSIRGVLHERLDRLERRERSVLERAAVAGRSFSLEAVLDLTPQEERESVQAGLLALVRQRFVRLDTTAPEEGFRFHHALIRDAAYDGIPKATRADLHEQMAARLEAQAAENALVGYHLEQAFGFRRELGNSDPELAGRAGRLLRAAGQEAFTRSDLPATVSLLERARPAAGRRGGPAPAQAWPSSLRSRQVHRGRRCPRRGDRESGGRPTARVTCARRAAVCPLARGVGTERSARRLGSRPPHSASSKSVGTTSVNAGPGACKPGSNGPRAIRPAPKRRGGAPPRMRGLPVRSGSCSRSSAGVPAPRSGARRRWWRRSRRARRSARRSGAARSPSR